MFPAVTLLTLACAAFAQSSAFDAASVKPSNAADARPAMREDPGRLVFTNVTLAAIVLRAYDLKSYQLSAPDWLSSRRYDVVATLPPGATREQSNAMLRNLLEERFRFRAHREERELSGFLLTVAKGGPKLNAGPPKQNDDKYPVLTEPGIAIMEGIRGKAVVTFLTAKAQPLSALADLIVREFRLPVSDDTRLGGVHDFRLEFAPQRPGALPPASVDADAASDPSAAPNLMTAVQQQLGLRLVPAKVRVSVLVVDSADQSPSGN
jgi:uncharacterized protein (TIGR03435 family)